MRPPAGSCKEGYPSARDHSNGLRDEVAPMHRNKGALFRTTAPCLEDERHLRRQLPRRTEVRPHEIVICADRQIDRPYCGNIAGWACFITGGGFHFPVRASLFGA